MRRRGAALLALAVAGLCASPAAASDNGHLALERVVWVMRHGVRSPTQSPEALSRSTPQAWPAWPVDPGVLTDHGKADVALMGAWLRADYARRGLWPAKGCPAPGAVSAWADGQDQRTRVSGQTTLDAAFPGCGLIARHGPEGQGDALFSATSQGACPINADKAVAAVTAAAGGDLDRPGRGYEAARAALAKVVYGDTPCSDPKVCALAGPNSLKPAKDGVKIVGPLALGATVGENLLLEYAQGMPAQDVGWGRAASGEAIAQVMPMHNIESDLMRRTPYLAAHNGALMARAVLAALRGGSALPGQTPAGNRLTLIAGHDTNIANLSGILGVDWTLPGQPDKTPPDAVLAFEVWKNPTSGARFVRVALIYQTLDDLRASTPLTRGHPAGRVDLPITGCADGPAGECTVERFNALISARLPAECVLPPTP